MATSGARPWTPVRDELVRMCIGGVPTERLARALGVPPARVRARAYALGVVDLAGERRDGRVPRIVQPPCETRYTPLTRAQADRACEMAGTCTFNRIMTELGVGKKALRLALEERGVTPPTRAEAARMVRGEIVRLAELGMDCEEIARAVGRRPRFVLDVLRERGCAQGGKPRWGRAETERLVELTRAGRSHREVAEELGRTRDQVAWKVQKMRRDGFDI